MRYKSPNYGLKQSRAWGKEQYSIRIDRPIARISSSLVLYCVPRSGSFTLAK